MTYLRFPTIIEKMKKLVATIVINVLITLSVIAILIYSARDAHPSSGLYNLKRVGEKVVLTSKFSNEAKIDYYFELLERRQAEMKRVYGDQEYRYLLETSLRYTSLAGETANLIIASNNTQKADEMRALFIAHKENVNNMKKYLPKDHIEDTYLQDTLNYIDIYENTLPK